MWWCIQSCVWCPGKLFGVTDFVNPKELDKSVDEVHMSFSNMCSFLHVVPDKLNLCTYKIQAYVDLIFTW